MRKVLLTWVFFGGWKGYVIGEWGSYARARATPITVVSKNESNCLLENKMVSTLFYRGVRLL